MATKAGVWIDHKQAVVVLITDAGQQIKKFTSGGKQAARAGGRARSTSTRPMTSLQKTGESENSWANASKSTTKRWLVFEEQKRC